MRAWNQQPEGEIRERYLGEIAPLLEAARQVEPLVPVDKKRVRKRILRTLFGTRRQVVHGRLLPVLAALALLVVGGAAFATAQRLGLLPRLGGQEPQAPAAPSSSEPRRRKAVRGRPAPRTTADMPVPAAAEIAPGVEMAPVLPPPAPLLVPVPQTKLWVWAPAETSIAAPPVGHAATDGLATVTPLGRVVPFAAPVRRSASRSVGSLAMNRPADAGHPGPAAPVISAPPLEAFPVEPMGVRPAFVPSAPVVSAPPSPVPSPPPLKVALVAQPALAVPAAKLPVSTESPAPAVKPMPSDQSLFGQALRKLRAENHPTAALAALREHKQAYPRSSLSGERTALEVESLLALHRDKDALALLDTLSLEVLPRSGERFVVRGELRASAKRWSEAKADFEHALSRVSGSPAWHERALWGRGVSRLRLGEKEGGLADIDRYRDTYPKGRFAAEAARFFPEE